MKYFFLLIIFFSFSNLYSQRLKPDFIVDPVTGHGSLVLPLGKVSSGNIKVPVTLIYDAGGVRVGATGEDYSENNYNGSANTKIVGVNWSINAGGLVKREVRGLPDDLYPNDFNGGHRGWIYSNVPESLQSFPQSSSQTKQNFLFSIGDLDDTEPDLFTVSAPGLNCRFILDASVPQGMTQRPVIKLDRNNYTIDYLIDGSTDEIQGFTIKTESGLVYEFNPTYRIEETVIANPRATVEDTAHYSKLLELYRKPIKYIEEWGLTSITSAEDKIGVILSYSTNISVSSNSSMSFRYKEEDKNFFYKIKRQQISSLRGIQSNYEAISILSNGVSIYTAEFQGSFTYDYITGGTERYISSIQENCGNTTLPPLKFKYYELDLKPSSKSLERDAWGYYNASGEEENLLSLDYNNRSAFYEYHNISGPTRYKLQKIDSNNNFTYWTAPETLYGKYMLILDSLINDYNTTPRGRMYPRIFIYPNRTNYDRYRLNVIPGDNNFIELPGANRNVNEAVIAYGSLNKVELPNGGYISWEYESNSYQDEVNTSLVNKGPGLRIKKVTIHDGIDVKNNITKEYTYSNGSLRSKPIFAMPWLGRQIVPSWEGSTLRSGYDLNEDQSSSKSVFYSYVEEKISDKGTTSYSFSGSHPTYTPSESFYAYTQPYSNGILNSFPFPSSINDNYANDNYLIEKRLFDKNGFITDQFIYTYDYFPDLVEKYVYGVKLERYEKGSDNFFYGSYRHLQNGVNMHLITEEHNTFNKSAYLSPLDIPDSKISNVTNYSYENSAHNNLTKLESVNSDGLSSITKFKYVYDFNPSLSNDDYTNAIKWLKENHHGEWPVETIYSIKKPNDTEKVYKSSLILYKKMDKQINNSSYSFCYPEKYLHFQTNNPIIGFGSSSIINNNGQDQLSYDAKYKIKAKILSWDMGQPTETESFDKSLVAKVLESPTYKKADIKGARLAEILFRNYAGSLNNGGTLSKINILKNKLAENYIFSCWINAANPGILTITLTDNANQVISREINYDNTANKAVFYKCIIPVSSLQTSFNMTAVTSNSITTEGEILLHPEHSFITYYTQGSFSNITSEINSKGDAIFYDYDSHGRLLNTKDKDHFILKSIAYSYVTPKTLNSKIWGQKTSNGNFQFTSTVSTDISNVTYHWDFGDYSQSSNEANPQHQYNQAGTYNVVLTVSHPNYPTEQKTLKVVIIRNITTSMCTSGPIVYNLDTRESVYEENPCAQPLLPPGENEFYFNYDNSDVPSTAIVTYRWAISHQGTITPLSETSSRCRINKSFMVPSDSYYITCEMTISNCDYLYEEYPNETMQKTFVQGINVLFTNSTN